MSYPEQCMCVGLNACVCAHIIVCKHVCASNVCKCPIFSLVCISQCFPRTEILWRQLHVSLYFTSTFPDHLWAPPPRSNHFWLWPDSFLALWHLHLETGSERDAPQFFHEPCSWLPQSQILLMTTGLSHTKIHILSPHETRGAAPKPVAHYIRAAKSRKPRTSF